MRPCPVDGPHGVSELLVGAPILDETDGEGGDGTEDDRAERDQPVKPRHLRHANAGAIGAQDERSLSRLDAKARADGDALALCPRCDGAPDQSAAGCGDTWRPGRDVRHGECAYSPPMNSRPFALMPVLVLAGLMPGVATATPMVGAPVGSPLRLLRPDLTARRGGPVLPRRTFATVLSPDGRRFAALPAHGAIAALWPAQHRLVTFGFDASGSEELRAAMVATGRITRRVRLG